MLTNTQCQAAKPGSKDRKLSDGRGLCLRVKSNGSKLWQFRYQVWDAERRVEKTLSFGVFPAISLLEARAKADVARTNIRNGVDPAPSRTVVAAPPQKVTLREIVEGWFAQRTPDWSPAHSAKNRSRIDCHIVPRWGNVPAEQLKPMDLLAGLRAIQDMGRQETAHRVAQILSCAYRRAVRLEVVPGNPAASLSEDLRQWRSKHYPYLRGHAAIASLMKRIDGYVGMQSVQAALKLAPHVFLRPSELRRAEWAEIDLEAKIWTLPAEKMKARREHLVPLSQFAVDILREQQKFADYSRYVFPGRSGRKTDRPLSEAALGSALRGIGYSNEQLLPHGLRATASTALNESGWNRDWIEWQLAHIPHGVRAAYNRAHYLAGRARMMEAWSAYLTALKMSAAGNYSEAVKKLAPKNSDRESKN